MSEFIEVSLQQAAVTLADELDYVRAAWKLGIGVSELDRRITELENRLDLRIVR